MKMRLFLMPVLFAAFSATAQAHEVWLEPDRWEVESEAQFGAQLLNGEGFKGSELSWNPRVILRAEKWQGDGGVRLVGRFGDTPALSTTAGQDGLLTLIYQSSPNTVEYKDYEKFAQFVREKGLDTVLAEHKARKLPTAPIKEAFSRYVKSLVAVGAGQGADAPRGLEIEIVALNNPYTVDADQMMRFQVFYKSEVLAGNLVTLFERTPEGQVTLKTQVSDDKGIAAFKTMAGNTYLVDSVVMRVPAPALVAYTKGAVWESLWASLTFRVPDSQ